MNDQNWLFAYGSLMWDPCFKVTERIEATVEGYRRSFCLRSTEYRGTVEKPGLVLGLDETEGAACKGVVMRVDDADLTNVRARELTTGAYREAVLPLKLADGRTVDAISYVMQRDHEHYAGKLCIREQAEIIAGAEGKRGLNRDYLYNTVSHLAEIGLPDEELEEVAAEVRRICI